MGNIFDLALVAIIIISCAVCYKLGFFKTLKPFRKIAAFLVAWNFKSSPLVTSITDRILKADSVRARISEWVQSSWGEQIKSATEATDVAVTERYDQTFGIIGKIFGNIKEYCTSLYESTFGSGTIGGNTQDRISEYTSDVVNYISEGLLSFLSAIIGFAMLYFLTSIGISLSIKLFDKIFSKGVFGAVNRIVGGAVGIGYGFVTAWVIALLFVNVVPVLFHVAQESVLGGSLGVVDWFYTDFMLSSLFGIK